jgi:hypothetical protein
VQQKLFAAIEAGMVSANTVVSTALATGLVEALVSRADNSPGLWEEIESLMGPSSKRHAVAWRDFGHL